MTNLPENAQYEDLFDVISFDGFDFGKYYEHEQSILKPRLEALGFMDISFTMGESDSFGPLSRVCDALDKDGKVRHFIYG